MGERGGSWQKCRRRRQVRFARTGFLVFVAGYYAFQNIWLHLLWFGFAVALPLIWLRPSPMPLLDRRRPFLFWSAVFALTMLTLSLRPGAPRPDWLLLKLVLLAGDAVLLLLFLRMAFRLGHGSPLRTRRAMVIMVQVAGVTALISFAVFYGWMGNRVMTSRFENVVVHFGLAPVLTGLLYGFAGLAAAVLAVGEPSPKRRAGLLFWEGVLLLGALCAHSRGAVLALAAGFIILVVVRFRRQVVLPLAVLLLVAVVYQFGFPQLANMARERAASRGEVVTEPPVSNPAAGMVARKDGGRLALYRILLGRMESPADHLLGRGRWANDHGTPRMTWALHPHSAYLATYYRGGIIGVGLLGMVLLLGGGACWRAARRGQPLWLVLVAYGVVALLFDGDDLVSMASLPRVEPLLFWFPLAAGAGAAARLARLRPGSACLPTKS